MPAQSVKPAPQEARHAPAEHTWPAGHCVPHPPQWARSLVTSTQRPSQGVVPVTHSTRHAPLRHTWPMGHALPQPPQLARSVCVSAQ